MPRIHHLGVTVADLTAAAAQFDPVLTALGYTRHDDETCITWWAGEAPGILLYAAREQGTGPHVHGRVGWQHLGFEVASRDEVERLHRIATDAGWTAVREPAEYPRFTATYYASFVEDANGIRIEFLHA
ncbi:VOC family protein [Microbacterium sp.]|uniref:VOC family protein n=1 Tax=Microbacterium sp. TaxID=51671 RepID=UPI0039E4817F